MNLIYRTRLKIEYKNPGKMKFMNNRKALPLRRQKKELDNIICKIKSRLFPTQKFLMLQSRTDQLTKKLLFKTEVLRSNLVGALR